MTTSRIGSPSHLPVPATAVRFSILGPLQAHDGTRQLEIGPTKQRIVLALLLFRANGVVPASVLSDALWDDEPPRTARKNLQTYVATLRRTLGLSRQSAAAAPAPSATAGALLHRAPGYELRVGAEQVDVLAFHDHARAGRLAARDGDVPAAAEALGRALRLWRGPVLAELQTVPAIAAETARLTDRYLAAYEDWAEAELALGHHAGVAEDIAELVRSHPFRERLRHSQMVALYRSGRQPEALAHFEAVRQLLARDLGLRPSPVLSRLHEAMLSEDPALDFPDRRVTVSAEAAPPALAVAPTPPAPTAASAEPMTSAAVSPNHGQPDGPVRPSSTRHPDCIRLPRDVADFTGRAEQISVLLDALGSADKGQVALITGPAGIGKTALAAHCAHRLGERFPGARAAVGLRTADGRARPGSEVVGELLRGAGVAGALPRGLPARAALLRTSIDVRGTLFVLDDAASQAQVTSLLAVLPDCAVVVTGRRLHGDVEASVHIRLSPLATDQGRVLLERIVGVDRVRAEPDAARELLVLCHGLPLAIRIVGRKLAGLRHLTLARYAARLTDEDLVLDELAVAGLRIRPRLAAWYQDLDSGDRSALARLARCGPAGFGVAEAAMVLGVGPRQAELAIERLVETHFIDADLDADLEADVESDLESGLESDLDAVLDTGIPDVVVHALTRTPSFRLQPLVRIFLRDQASR